MTDVTTLETELTAFLETTLHEQVQSPDTDLLEAGVLDSLRFVDLLLHLERTYGVVIALEDLEIDAFRSIGKIARFVAARRADGARASAWARGEGSGDGTRSAAD